mgnify:CR=1 FL=1
MASIISRNNRYCVVYSYVDEQGNRKQKWQTFKTLPEAKARKTEIEYNQQLGTFTIPNSATVSELLTEYVSLYGKTKWSISAYTSNMSLIRHYIEPLLGSVKLKESTVRTLEKYYQTLLKTPAVPKMTNRKNKKSSSLVTPATIRKVHNLLRSAFNQAEKWDLIEKNPARYATIPKEESRKRDIWDAQTLFKAIDCCKDDRLKLCMNVAFACSLRIGELLALTWDCVDISEESIMAGKAYIYVNKELQRVSKSVMSTLESKDILVTFPEQGAKNKTVLVLKKPKTLTSTRKVFLPKTVAEMLVAWKMEQDATIEALGSEYTNYQLVIATPYGLPTEASRIRKAMKDLIQDNDLPPDRRPPPLRVPAGPPHRTGRGHGAQRHIKAVQGDSGHAQAQMVTDQYSHILDENRRANAQLVEKAFYGGQGAESVESEQGADTQVADQAQAAGMDIQQLMKILSNPEMVNMLKMLSKTMG